jgi:Tfp pilus assembly PilM family ATPase
MPGDVGAAPASSFSKSAHAVASALREGRFAASGKAGARIVTALPPELVHLRTFRIPPLPHQEREAEVLRQARQGAAFGDSEPAHVEAHPVGETRQGRDVREQYLSAAARESDVRAFLEALGPVVVESLQAEPYAVYRAVAGKADFPDRAGTQMVVHLGESETLVLIGGGTQLRVIRKLGMGAADLDRAAARKLGTTPAEARRLRCRRGAPGAPESKVSAAVRAAMNDATRALLEEVARESALCARYYAVTFRGPAPRAIRLLSCTAPEQQLNVMLESATGLAVDARGVFAGLPGAPEDENGWATAFGLALTFAPPLPAAAVRDTTDEPAGEVAVA